MTVNILKMPQPCSSTDHANEVRGTSVTEKLSVAYESIKYPIQVLENGTHHAVPGALAQR